MRGWSRQRKNSSKVEQPAQYSHWQKRFFRWIDKRSPLARVVQLTRRNLYILPTKTGLCFFLLSFILWLLGTSYQNNLVLALSYLLLSLLIVAIFHTYANLAGLQVSVLGGKPAFVGETIYFSLQLATINTPRRYDNLLIRWWSGESGCFDFAGQQPQQIQVGVPALTRGIVNPGKLLIESVYPLGIIRCWTWLNLEASAVAFPKPLTTDFPAQSSGDSDSEQGELVAGSDDFSGLKEYRAGDPIKHIAWKHYAREQGLYSKEYASVRGHDNWLNWDDFSHLNGEDRLSAMCYWVLQFERVQGAYGLRLPGREIMPGLGDGHRLRVLTELACFNINQQGS